MPTVVRTTQARDFLALVPHVAGFEPRNSVVLVAFRGTRTCGAMRFDLPIAVGPRELKKIATSVVGMLSKLPGVDAVIPVVYTDAPFRRRIPYESFIREIVTRADFSGFLVRDALCVADTGWASYLDPDYPPGGHDLGLIASSAVTDLPELQPVGGILDGADLPSVLLDRSERVARRVKDLRAEFDTGRIEVLEARFPGLADVPLMMEQTLSIEPEELSVDDLALLILLLQPPPSRDAVMLLWAFDLETGDRSFDLNDRFHAGEDVSDDPDGCLMLGEGRRPDPKRIDRAVQLLKVMVAHAPRTARPPLLCMLAWLNWAVGRASVGRVFLDRALDIDHRYGLAELLGAMLGNGMLPQWAFENPVVPAERHDASSARGDTPGVAPVRGS